MIAKEYSKIKATIPPARSQEFVFESSRDCFLKKLRIKGEKTNHLIATRVSLGHASLMTGPSSVPSSFFNDYEINTYQWKKDFQLVVVLQNIGPMPVEVEVFPEVK